MTATTTRKPRSQKSPRKPRRLDARAARIFIDYADLVRSLRVARSVARRIGARIDEWPDAPVSLHSSMARTTAALRRNLAGLDYVLDVTLSDFDGDTPLPSSVLLGEMDPEADDSDIRAIARAERRREMLEELGEAEAATEAAA